MAAGDIIKEAGLIVLEVPVKASEDIELGEFVMQISAGSGFIAANDSIKVPLFMSLEAHVYADEDTHNIKVVAAGFVECQKISGSGAFFIGHYVECSATAGEIQKFDMTSGSWFQRIGIAIEAALDADTTGKILMGANQ